MKTSNAVLSVVAGVATGALLGVLFAPDKGSNTRGKLTRKSEDLVGELKGKVDYYKDRATQMVDRFADTIHSHTDGVTNKYENGITNFARPERKV